MKQTLTAKMAMVLLSGTFVLGTLADGPAATVSDVVVRQRWPWSRLVDIDYVLTGDATQRVDISLQAYNGSAALTLPSDSLSGDLHDVSEGARKIVWDPMKTAYTNQLLTQFRADLTTTNLPVYIVVDLAETAGGAGRIEYVYPGDPRLITEGRWTNAWLSVTNDSAYRTSKLVLRRVSAGTYTMGKNETWERTVTLTKDFYIGVFELTQSQWLKMMPTNPSAFVNAGYPVEQASYNDIRGLTNNAVAINWPSTGLTVATNSFLGKLRSRTRIAELDLPTSAQWEYACRSGTVSYYNDGVSSSSEDTGILDGLGWYNGNASASTHTVGLKTPNSWGLFDMHGNTHEWCLDWWADTPSGTSDPVGPSVISNLRVVKGGSYASGSANCRSGYRGNQNPASTANFVGFRVVWTLR